MAVDFLNKNSTIDNNSRKKTLLILEPMDHSDINNNTNTATTVTSNGGETLQANVAVNKSSPWSLCNGKSSLNYVAQPSVAKSIQAEHKLVKTEISKYNTLDAADARNLNYSSDMYEENDTEIDNDMSTSWNRFSSKSKPS